MQLSQRPQLLLPEYRNPRLGSPELTAAEMAYQNYRAWCRRLKIKASNFSEWIRNSSSVRAPKPD